MRQFLVFLLACSWAVPAWCAGLFTPDTGIVAMGRGGAFVATADDNSALYFNPAGLWQMDGLQVRGGMLGMLHPTCFTREGGADRYKLDDWGNPIGMSGDYETVQNENQWRPIPEASVSFGLENPDMTWALGLYAPLAPWLEYPEFGANRYRLTRLGLVQGNLALGWGWRLPGPMNWLAVGATFQVIALEMEQDFWASADLEAEGDGTNPEDPQWDIHTAFSAKQYIPYFNVGLMFIPSERVRIGVSIQPPYTFEGAGSVELHGTSGDRYLEQVKEDFGDLLGLAGIDLDTAPLNITGVDDDITVTTHQPAILKAGVAVQPVSWLDLELDGHFEFWSVAEAVVASEIDVPLEHCDDDGCQPLQDELQDRVSGGAIEIDPCDPALDLVDCSSLGNYRGSGGDGTYSIALNWKTSYGIRFGGEVQPFKSLGEQVGFRFGYAFESSAVPDETLSLMMIDNNKHLFGLGVSFRDTWLEVHVSYAFILHHTRTIGSDASVGMQTGLSGTAVNKVDAGTYCARDHLFGVNAAFNFSAMHKAAKARKLARTQGVQHF